MRICSAVSLVTASTFAQSLWIATLKSEGSSRATASGSSAKTGSRSKIAGRVLGTSSRIELELWVLDGEIRAILCLLATWIACWLNSASSSCWSSYCSDSSWSLEPVA